MAESLPLETHIITSTGFLRTLRRETETETEIAVTTVEIKLHIVTTIQLLETLAHNQKNNQKSLFQQRLLSILQQRSGIHLWSDLVTALWGDRKDGGPADPRNYITVEVCKLRRLNHPIVTHWGRGIEYRHPFR
jgi:hypothetical protein